MDLKLLNQFEFDFGKISFYNLYVCLEIAENHHFSIAMFDELLHLKYQIIGYRKILYISHRTNSSSFDPTVFATRKQEIIDNFLALLVVSNRHSDVFESGYVKQMCPIESHYFSSFNKALVWISHQKPHLKKYLV